MKQFVTVLKFELNNYFKNKSFMVTTFVLLVVVLGLITIPPMIPGLLKEDTSVKEQEEGQEEEELDALGILVKTSQTEAADMIRSVFPAKWESFDKEEDLKRAVEEEAVRAGFILEEDNKVTYVVNNLEVGDSFSGRFADAYTYCLKQQYLLKLGLSQEEAMAADMIYVDISPQVLGKNSARNYAYTYVLVFVTYFLILLYGQMIAVAVTTEKSNRAIEILVTSVNPNSLIFGKVLAGAIAGVLQVVLIVGSGCVFYGMFQEAWGGMLDFLFDIPAKVLAAYAFFGTLSYLLYAFIYGTLGALVSKTEDISKSATPVTMIYVVSFMIAIFGMMDTENMIVKVASFIPFTSGNAMFMRVAMGNVSAFEIIVSGAILVISCVATGLLAAKLFRFGTLHYGNPLKITKALKSIRQQ